MRVVVEIPIGSSIKYEYHQGTLMVDRVLSMPYPGNYGYIEDTLALDGDELDVILLVPYGLQIGCRVQCRAVGVLCMEDEEGEDHKLLAVPEADPASASRRYGTSSPSTRRTTPPAGAGWARCTARPGRGRSSTRRVNVSVHKSGEEHVRDR